MTRGKLFFCMGGELDERQTYERLLSRRMVNKVCRFIGNYCSQKFSIYRNAGFSSLVNFVDGKPPRLPLSSTRRAKQEIENKLRPLIFRNFFRNIQKIKNWLRINMLRPSSVAVRRHLPPGGKATSKAVIKISNGLKQSVMKRAMPA